MTVGVPNYNQGSKFAKKNYFRVKKEGGDNFFRILPPFGSLAEKGVWMVYGQTHWLRNSKNQARVVACIEDKDMKTKMVKVRCPICDEVARRKEEGEAMLAQSGLTGEALEAKKKMLNDWEFNHSRQSRYYMNALNREGQIGRLEIKTKHKQSLLPLIKKLNEDGLDPVGMSGVELNFSTSGKGREKVFTVEAAVEKISAVEQRIKVSPLTEELIKRMETEAFDMKDMFKVLTAAELKRVVDSDFNGEVVDALTSNAKQDPAEAAAEAAAAAEDDPSDVPAYKPNGFVPSASTQVATQTTPPVPVAAPAPQVQPQTVQQPPPQQQAQQAAPKVNVATSKDAFMALFGPKK